MADFQPPPTWALPILVDEDSGKATFNPVWIKWFVDLTAVINASGGGGGGAIDHNSLSNLQGGQANQYYHLNANELARVQKSGRQGSDVASATAIAPSSTDGADYFQVTGTTQIDRVDNTGWQGGSVITLKFDSNPVVRNNQAASGTERPVILSGAANFSSSASDTLTLRYDSADAVWYEQSRSVN